MSTDTLAMILQYCAWPTAVVLSSLAISRAVSKVAKLNTLPKYIARQ